MRGMMAALTLLAGLALVALGFFSAAPIGQPTSPIFSNPRVPFAPAIFILGVMLVFLSAVVYELYPGREA